ncbi:hypothetical protein HDU84_008736 [Entophlyctis sp. JEL0112]|nr:hypothetical protein HDU84_008736 [Entophlyctis sp. JEL0112]
MNTKTSYAPVFERLRRVTAPVIIFMLLPVILFAEFAIRTVRKGTPPFLARGKIVVITGASSGIGAAVAEAYAREGALLVLIARRRQELEEVGIKCKELGAADVLCEAVDVADESAFQAVLEKIGTHYQHIDLIIFNAGVNVKAKVADLHDMKSIRRLTEINYMSAVAGAIYALPFLKAAKRGRIAVISSIDGLFPHLSFAPYCGSKFALQGFFSSLRLEEPTLDVIMVYPSFVDTEMPDKIEGLDEETINRMKKSMSVMTAEISAELIVDAVNKGARDKILTMEGQMLWFMRTLAPRATDAIAATYWKNIGF